MPFSKLDSGLLLILNKREIVDTLFLYYENQIKITETDKDDPNDAKIEEEYRILLNKLSISKEKAELISAFEIQKYVKS